MMEATLSLLPLESLLRPIPGAAPAGESLRYEPVFDTLRDLRREDDQQAPRGVWRSRLKLADWGAVIATAQDTLSNRSKDLQVAAWLTEALVVRQGLEGASAGFALLAGLVEQYWPLLWPHPGTDDDADEDARLTILEWLDGKLSERLMLQPLADGGEPPPSWHERASLHRRRAGTQGRPLPEDEERHAAILKAVAHTPGEFYQAMSRALRDAEAALAGLLAALRRTGTAAPPAFTQLRGTFGLIEAFLRAELATRGHAPDQPQPHPPERDPEMTAQPRLLALAPEAPAEPPVTAPAVAGPGPRPPGPIASREDAYQALDSVARYLEQVEPHSPVPALLRRAVSWGRMGLPELLAELMREEGGPFRLLGLSPGIAER
jgi:type VI secretion system ImpA family protein